MATGSSSKNPAASRNVKRGAKEETGADDRKTDLMAIARTVVSYGGVYPFMLTALGVGAVNRRLSTGLDFMMSSYPDFALAAGGVDVRVTGEERLWSHRPAVFIFNHRNMIDGLIVARLLQRDYTSIAKQEMAKAPLIGTMGRAAGVVFIDRADTNKAIESLHGATEAFKKGKSIIIAPEGTRQDGVLLGPFKKGAFRLAMDGGVPLVPIAFHNAEIIQPAKGFVMNSGTVDVEVLEPIDVSKWTVKTLDKRIAEVHANFLSVLERGVAAT